MAALDGNGMFHVEHSDRPPFTGVHDRHGTPTAIYRYADLERVHFQVCRYERPGEQVAAVFWTLDGGVWKPLPPPKPWPLYRLDLLLKSPRAPVLLVSDENCAEAAQRLFRSTIVMTWPSGVRGGTAHEWVDWTPLSGRVVTLWPRADESSREEALLIAGRLINVGCRIDENFVGVKFIDTRELPDDGWDLAQAIQEGWTYDRALKWGQAHMRPVKKIEPADFAPLPLPAAVTVEPEPERPRGVTSKWADLQLSMAKGVPHANLDNLVKILEAHPPATRSAHYDEFLQKVVCEDGSQWADIDDLQLAMHLQRAYQMPTVQPGVVNQAVNVYAYQHRRNEAQDWLKGLKWDGIPRLAMLLSKAFGTPQNAYTEAVGRCFMMGMVARVLQPGCKVDNMPVFEGQQGILKGTALRAIGGRWFAELHEKIGEKDFYMVLRGKMLLEITELHSFGRVAIETIKGVISNQNDTFRAPYERRAADHPRQCVFCGTTNTDDWNTDDSGARRFWPVTCGRINVSWIEDYREQLFAEAVERVQDGQPWWDVPMELAQAEQSARFAGDVWDDAVCYFLSKYDQVTVRDVLETGLGIDKPEKWDRTAQSRVVSILKRSGYQRKTVKGVRCWVKAR